MHIFTECFQKNSFLVKTGSDLILSFSLVIQKTNQSIKDNKK